MTTHDNSVFQQAERDGTFRHRSVPFRVLVTTVLDLVVFATQQTHTFQFSLWSICVRRLEYIQSDTFYCAHLQLLLAPLYKLHRLPKTGVSIIRPHNVLPGDSRVLEWRPDQCDVAGMIERHPFVPAIMVIQYTYSSTCTILSMLQCEDDFLTSLRRSS